MNDETCIACGGTGINSKGGPCAPCVRNDRWPVRDAVKAAIDAVFSEAAGQRRVPTMNEVLATVRSTMSQRVVSPAKPSVVYGAGFRDEEGSMGMFDGPFPDMAPLLKKAPPGPGPGPAYIVKLTKLPNGEIETEPMARWRDGAWQLKKKK